MGHDPSWSALPRKMPQSAKVGKSPPGSDARSPSTWNGEWNHPDGLQVPAARPLMQAILAARGVETWRAPDVTSWNWCGSTATGSAMRRQYRLVTTREFPRPANPPLVDGDTVIVNRSRYGPK